MHDDSSEHPYGSTPVEAQTLRFAVRFNGNSSAKLNGMSTAFFSHPDFLLHENFSGHPERPARLTAIEEKLQANPNMKKLQRPQFSPAGESELEFCHAPELVGQIKSLAQNGGGAIDGDTYVGEHSFEIARFAVGAAVAAVSGVLQGEFSNAFVASRPPGHHAESRRAMGFCLFNSIAIAARAAQRKHGLERVAIVDFDVHHGNGTQEIFYEDGSVFFASVHQWPLFPGTGRSSERGAGAGLGATLNFPLEAGHGDAGYFEIWQEVGEAVREFAPQLILVSAGYDAHARDPLGGMKLSADGFAALAKSTMEWAQELCAGRVVFVLEGGYDLQGLSDAVTTTLGVLQKGNE
jgi:acetoin utilization deacetylase AcuC-like enzyme